MTLIGYTSFEEPAVVLDGPTYRDPTSSAFDHELANLPGQNIVQYQAGNGTELGFRSYFVSMSSNSRSGLTESGNSVGVVGDTSIVESRSFDAGLAPDGTQFYMLEDTDVKMLMLSRFICCPSR